MIKQYSKKSKQPNGEFNFKNFLDKRYNGGVITYLDESSGKDINFDSLELDYLPLDEGISKTFYKTLVEDSITVMRNCYNESDETMCISDPFNVSDNTSSNLSFITRKTTKPLYFLEDILDSIFISSSKHKIKTCNGTNKTGDMFYYGTDKQHNFNRSQSKPPKKVPIFRGEELNIIGFYIQSPYKKGPNIIGGTEYTNLDNNSKHYNTLLSKSCNINALISPINDKQLNNDEVVIKTDYLEFSYDDYDPNKDYFVIFNNANNQIDKQTFNETYLNRLLPSIENIITIESGNLNKCTSIADIEKVINKYGIYFKELTINSITKIQKNITKNIISLNSKQALNKLIYLTNKGLNKKYAHIYSLII